MISYSVTKPLTEGKQLLLDTDIGADCDDAGAISVLFALQKAKFFPLAGIVNCTSNPFGNGAIDALCEYYGHPQAETGIYQAREINGSYCSYNKYLTEHFVTKPSVRTESTAFYRKILSAAEDQSIVLVTIGHFNAVADILRAEPKLFSEKVNIVVSMAGAFPGKAEWNITEDIPSAAYFIEHCPAPIIFSGYEIGLSVQTGYTPSDSKHPAAIAYELYLSQWEGKYTTRSSWDLTTVQYAIEGTGDFYTLSPEGEVRITDEGISLFNEKSGGKRYYMIKKTSDELLAGHLEALMKSTK